MGNKTHPGATLVQQQASLVLVLVRGQSARAMTAVCDAKTKQQKHATIRQARRVAIPRRCTTVAKYAQIGIYC